MKKHLLQKYEKYLKINEKSKNTIDKYLFDVESFIDYLDKKHLTKIKVIEYKEYLIENYKVSTVNSKLSSINCFLKFINKSDCTVKLLKVQNESFRDENDELSYDEYLRLLDTAKSKHKESLFYIMQTLASTGIRASELQFITKESLLKGEVIIKLKGKTRVAYFPEKLRLSLIEYAEKRE